MKRIIRTDRDLALVDQGTLEYSVTYEQVLANYTRTLGEKCAKELLEKQIESYGSFEKFVEKKYPINPTAVNQATNILGGGLDTRERMPSLRNNVTAIYIEIDEKEKQVRTEDPNKVIFEVPYRLFIKRER